MENNQQWVKAKKPKIGITMGDFNGIGPEIIIKALNDRRINGICTPIIYGSGKVLTKYKKLINDEQFSYHQYNTSSYLNEKKPNVVNCWHDNHNVEPGRVTEIAGQCAYLALERSTEDLKSGFIDAVVTCPINKANIQQDNFRFPGHTEYYAHHFGTEGSSLMLLCGELTKVAVATGHIPLEEVARTLTKELVHSKIGALLDTLKNDFGILRPKVAVLGLNPHAGEDGLLGMNEKEVIGPAVTEWHKKGALVYGPYPADGFFGAGTFKKFDAVLAMYHDQGLIPFKLLCFEDGVNFTSGLSVVRTSPDHGTAYSIAGKNEASEQSLLSAIFTACDIVRNRENKVERGIKIGKIELNSERDH